MADALDTFVVDGIEHNIPFLAALMQHPRWREGRLSTAFIAEEFPEGFKPIAPSPGDLDILAAIALTVELVRKERLDRLSDRLRPHTGKMRTEWEVRIKDDYVPITIAKCAARPPVKIELSIRGGEEMTIRSDWQPGDAVWSGYVNERAVKAQLRPVLNGMRIDWKGMSIIAHAMQKHVAALEKLMPVKIPPDTSKLLLCPMPGLIVSINVTKAQEVKAGETLAIVEAMKMENVLRADRDLTVSVINAKQGDSLAVDAVIMEFV
jgi:propionyl-CoA carboxylase alpha chain